ncbi:S1C family serine protease [Methylacidimicrobium sp. AP8]|uniref:S1C family serine protease n=1 Tax=Methylacidimicrobium sp. AP8 TaxID=2730359 RepID=UPI00192135CA|nr:trypsin-like peptidase domain-containing protein [Methylacidimicrobium sp. AP8]
MTFNHSLCAAVLLSLSGAGSCLAGQESVSSLASDVGRIFRTARHAVVRVRVRHESTDAVCSGFFIDANGTVATVSELVSPGQEIRVESERGVLPAVLLGQDSRTGLALLRTPSNGPTPFLRVAGDTEPEAGSFVVGVGYPFNLSASPIVGLVLGSDRQFQDRLFCVSHIRVDMTISPGELGAPLLDLQGRVIGVATMVVNEGRWAYALPVRAVKRVVADLRRYGRVRYAWAGIGVSRVGGDRGESFVAITRLFPNSAARASGLQEGDRLEQINGKPVHHLSDVVDASFYAPVGRPMVIAVSRNGKIERFSLLVGDRPADNPGGAPGSSPATAEASPTAPPSAGSAEKTGGGAN